MQQIIIVSQGGGAAEKEIIKQADGMVFDLEAERQQLIQVMLESVPADVMEMIEVVLSFSELHQWPTIQCSQNGTDNANFA